jgi:serine/threonine protein kinase
MIYEFLCGIPPFYDDKSDQKRLNQKILCNEPNLSFNFLTDDAKDLLRGLLQKLPENRLSIEQIKAHPWFKSISFKAMEARKVVPPYVPQLTDEDDTIHFPSEFTDLALSPNSAAGGSCLDHNEKFKDFDFNIEDEKDEEDLDTDYSVKCQPPQPEAMDVDES